MLFVCRLEAKVGRPVGCGYYFCIGGYIAAMPRPEVLPISPSMDVKGIIADQGHIQAGRGGVLMPTHGLRLPTLFLYLLLPPTPPGLFVFCPSPFWKPLGVPYQHEAARDASQGWSAEEVQAGVGAPL